MAEQGKYDVMAKACRIHKHMSTTAAGNKIGAPGGKDISVALAKCSNLHTLNLSGQWVAWSEYGAMGAGICSRTV